MADNFDTNVARRKPNILERKRPVHPWDVARAFEPEEDSPEDAPPRSPAPPEQRPAKKTVLFPTGSNPSSAPGPVPEVTEKSVDGERKDRAAVPPPPVPTEPVRADHIVPARKPKRTFEPESRQSPTLKSVESAAVSQKRSSLSDTISIHSNFCKLDNDISDLLMPRLSASAQSVYLRLYRQSYGWNRNWAAESLPKLTEFCNLSLQTVRKAIKELELVGCIRKEFSDYHKATVYRILLPSEFGLGKDTISNTAMANTRGLKSNTLSSHRSVLPGKNLDGSPDTGQIPAPFVSGTGEYQDFDPTDTHSGGQDFVIQSTFFRGTSVYNILESGGALPRNMHIYMTDIHLAGAVDITDEFYDSIGFSVVSRALYRKSLLDYFDMVGSGFSSDDIRYAVRWTFKNSRSRPESFSLIKHTLHLAMNDLIQDMKTRSAEKAVVEEKQEALQKNLEWRSRETVRTVSADDLRTWQEIMETLRASLSEHSFSAFIEPLRLQSVEEDRLCVNAPPDSVSWVSDHYADRIGECYREITGKSVTVVVS